MEESPDEDAADSGDSVTEADTSNDSSLDCTLEKTSSRIHKILKRKKINSNNIKKSINNKFSPKKFDNELGKFLNSLDFIY